MEEKGGGKCGGKLGRSLSGAKGDKPPHEPQTVREKLT